MRENGPSKAFALGGGRKHSILNALNSVTLEQGDWMLGHGWQLGWFQWPSLNQWSSDTFRCASLSAKSFFVTIYFYLSLNYVHIILLCLVHCKLYIKIDIKNREDKDENDSVFKYLVDTMTSF